MERDNLKEEVVIVNGAPNSVFENGNCNEFIEPKFTKYVNKRWNARQPIIREPQYVAIHVTGTNSIRVIIEIDYHNSNLKEGIIVPLGDPISVYIPIKRFGENKLQGIKYTTFRKLITHESANDL